MAPAELELTIMAADDVKNVTTFGGKMDLFAVVYIDPNVKQTTRVLHKAGRNPVWNDTVTLPLRDLIQRYPDSYLTVEIICQANLGNKVVGTAWLNLHEIYRLCSSAEDEPALVTLQLQRPISGRAQGVVRLSMKFKGDVTAPPPTYNASGIDKNDEVTEGIPVMGYPVAGPHFAAVPNYYENRGDGTTATGYPSLSADSSHSSSSSSSSGVVPYAYPPAYGGGYPRGFAYPAPSSQPVYQQVPYPYVQPPQPQRSSGGGLLLGLLGGAIGGLILGDILT